MPALTEHPLLPRFRERKGFAPASTPLREQDLAVSEDSKLPVAGTIDQRTPRTVSQPAHRPQGTDVARVAVA